MKTKAPLFHRMAVVAAVLGISVLGNLRSQASEAPLAPSALARSGVASGRSPLDVRPVASATPVAALEDDADDLLAADDAERVDSDDGQLVPAIYAWDPDVRFVYYRHVSKWM